MRVTELASCLALGRLQVYHERFSPNTYDLFLDLVLKSVAATKSS